MGIQTDSSDKRLFNRIAFDASVCIQNHDTNWESNLIDISLKGVLVQKPEKWTHKSQDEFNIIVKLEDHVSAINMQVLQVHEEDKQLGFQCINIDLESMAILKRLVELNLGDEEILERDVANMLIQ